MELSFVSKVKAESIRIGDKIRVDFTSKKDPKFKKTAIIEVKMFAEKERRCNDCGFLLEGDGHLYYGKEYCKECLVAFKKKMSQRQMGHPQAKNSFGGYTTISKNAK